MSCFPLRIDGPFDRLRLASVVVLCLGATTMAAEPSATLPPPASKKVDFAADIAPLFRKNCFSCHGAEHQEGGLRLDQKKRALEGGDSGAEIVAGKSAESRLVRMIAGVDEDFGRMPPDEKGTSLTAAEIGLIRAWIDQGAHWPDDAQLAQSVASHWSLQPIVRPATPKLADSTSAANSIDAFVFARLEQEKIKPSAAAERTALLRRLYLDLLGIAPPPEEVDEFLADTRPDAVDRLMDRLLASPHFGERWGRHWLDLARYADSDGYEKDRPRPFAWRYRDWVIDAINADLPYDQFTIAQIAGDMLPNATLAQRTASGFHRNTLHNTEGGTDPEEDRFKKTVDRTNTLGAVWLGLTVGCAQCHTHKYDPITQREYYSLYAFFNSIQESDIEAPSPDEAARLTADREAHAKRLAELNAGVAEYEKTSLAAAQQQWEASLSGTPSIWEPLDFQSLKSAKGATFSKQPDSSVLASGKNVVSDIYTLEAKVEAGKLTAIRLEVLPDASLPKNGPGRSKTGNLLLATIKVSVTSPDGKPTDAPLAAAKADFSQKGFSPELAINSDNKDGWAIAPQFGKRHVAVFELKEPVELSANARLTITLDQSYGKAEPHNIGRFRISASSSPTPVPFEGAPAVVAKALAVAPADRTKADLAAIEKYYRTVDPELTKLTAAVASNQAKAPKLPDDCKAQAVTELETTRVTNVLLRGDFLSPGDVVPTGTLAVLPPLKPRDSSADRLDLAHWLVDGSNPLPARVAANRVWQHLFGRGIVATSDDFGKQGEKPSHPELLDWLATEYASDWSLKGLIRKIVVSSTYQQSSAPRHDLRDIDPENILLARQTRQRVESEIIRDLSLSASGQLATHIGGPSVRPPQPAEYASVTYANSAKWVESKGADRYRRGMYTFFQRTSPYPMLMTFDTPDSNECKAQRQTSNTPLQALTLWNDPVFFESAQALGRRLVEEVPAASDARQMARLRGERAFLSCLSRRPTEEELGDIVGLYEAARRSATDDQVAARQLVGIPPVSDPAELIELAAWVNVGRALLNLDEFITRE